MKLLIVFLVIYCATNIVADADAEAKPDAKAQGIYLGGTGLYSDYGRHSDSPVDAVYSKRYGYGHNLGVLGIGHVLGHGNGLGHVLGHGNGLGNTFGFGNRQGFNHGYGLGPIAIVPYSLGPYGFGGYGLAGNGIGAYGLFGNGLAGPRILRPRIIAPVLGGNSLYNYGFPGYEFNGQNLIGHGVVGNSNDANLFAGQSLIGSPFLPGHGFQNTNQLAQQYQLPIPPIYSVPEFINSKHAVGFEQLNKEKFHGHGIESHDIGIGHQISHRTNDVAEHGISHGIDHVRKHGNDHIVKHGSDDGFRHHIDQGTGHGFKAIHSVQNTHKSPSVLHSGFEHGQGHVIQGLHSVQNVQKSVPISHVLKSIAVTQGNNDQEIGHFIPGLPTVQSVQKPIQTINKQKTIQFRIINPSTPFNFEKSDIKGFTPKVTEYKSFDSVEQY